MRNGETQIEHSQKQMKQKIINERNIYTLYEENDVNSVIKDLVASSSRTTKGVQLLAAASSVVNGK